MEQRFSTSGAVQIVVEHVPELRKALADLGTRGSRTAARKALRAGLAPVVKAVRSETKLKTGKVTGRLQKSPGQRLIKADRRNSYTFSAKAGLNVGKKRTTMAAGKKVAAGNYAPHAAIVALGSKVRKTAKGANLGAMPAHDIVPAAYRQSGPIALHTMKRKLEVEIQVETSKAYRRNKK